MTNHHANDCDVSVDFDELLADPAVAAATEDAEHRSALRATLVAQRKATHLTQKDVARLMQTTQSSVSELENGAVDPHLSTLQRYARAVGARVVVRASIPQLSADNDADVWAASVAPMAYTRREVRIGQAEMGQGTQPLRQWSQRVAAAPACGIG